MGKQEGKWSRQMKVRLRYVLLAIAVILTMWGVNDATIGGSVADAYPAGKFYNPIFGDGADPWVVQYNGDYYFTKTGGNKVQIWKSPSITGFQSATAYTAWTNSGTTYTDIWAPELHYFDGYWYIYFAAANGDATTRRIYVLKSAASDPMSSYTFIGKVSDPSDQWAIDGSVFELNGSMYFIWSGKANSTDSIQRIYIAPMDSPTHISGNRVLISSPTYSWETSFADINEGPEILQHNGDTFLIYSANASWKNGYCLGMLTLTGTDPLVASNWAKKSTPVFQSSGNVYGPGHNGFTKSIDGTQDWIVYHAAKYDNAGWDRSIRAQKFTWNADGTPNFGTPTSTDNAVTLPSGEVLERTSYEAEDAALTDTQLVTKSTASGGTVVGHIDFADSAVEFTVHVPVAGSYRMYVRYDNGTAGDSTHNIAVNGTSAGSITYPKTDAWLNPNIVTKLLTLQAGANTITFTKGTGFAELDFIQISTLLYEGEDATFFDATVGPHASASQKKVIGHIDFADSYVTFNVKAPTTGNYTMQVRYHNGTANNSAHNVYVNGGTSSTISYPHFSDWLTQGTATKTVSLNAGNNTIKFMKGTGFAEIDYITVTKQ